VPAPAEALAGALVPRLLIERGPEIDAAVETRWFAHDAATAALP